MKAIINGKRKFKKGEFRKPKKSEFYFSGGKSIISQAVNDCKNNFFIAVPIEENCLEFDCMDLQGKINSLCRDFMNDGKLESSQVLFCIDTVRKNFHF